VRLCVSLSLSGSDEALLSNKRVLPKHPRRGARAGRCQVRKRHFLSHLYIKCILLPRQARDKHRGNSKKVPFSLSLHTHRTIHWGSSGRQVRKRRVLFINPILRLKHHHFTKTGSGQTQGNLETPLAVYSFIFICRARMLPLGSRCRSLSPTQSSSRLTLRCEQRISFEPFLYTENNHVAKTGSGQTGKTQKQTRVLLH
jgi:hypothetical protein